jgi:hypothetical protein
MMVVVMEKGGRQGMRAIKVKEKKTVQESMRKKLVISQILSRTTSMSELEEVKLLIATVLLKEYFSSSSFSLTTLSSSYIDSCTECIFMYGVEFLMFKEH